MAFAPKIYPAVWKELDPQDLFEWILKKTVHCWLCSMSLGLPSGTSGKERACQYRRHKRHGFDPWVRKIPLEEKRATHSSILASSYQVCLFGKKNRGATPCGLEKGIATHSRVLAWRILWTEEPGRLPSLRLQRVRHDWSDLAHTGPPSNSCRIMQ